MIHLKKFNESTGKLYQLLGQYSSEHVKRCIDIQPKTLKKLSEWGLQYSVDMSKGHSAENYGQNGGEFEFVHFRNNKKIPILDGSYLAEIDDDWFLISLRLPPHSHDNNTDLSITVFYKCDTLDGLHQLLKDKGIIE